MVTAAFLLFTVSTLAAHINAVPTKLNHDPCEGKTLCFEKPADHPQEEELNDIVANSDLRHFYRVKREIYKTIRNTIEDDSCIDRIEPPARTYDSTDIKKITRDILETRSFKHLLSEIICKTTEPEHTESESWCTSFNSNSRCKKVTSRVYLKTEKNNTLVEQDITTDCRCDLKV